MKSLTAILMTLTIVLCSVVQYHHHDHEGNIFIYTVVGEFEMGQPNAPHHHDNSSNTCHHHHHKHDNHCSDTENCSMHLDQLTAHEKQTNIAPEQYPLCIVILNQFLQSAHLTEIASGHVQCSHAVPLPPSPLHPSWLMRGPPSLICN